MKKKNRKNWTPKKYYRLKSEMQNPLKFSKDVKMDIFIRDKGRCLYCGETNSDNLTYAHLIPKSKGGMGVKENGFLCCGNSKESCHHRLDETVERKWMLPHAENYLRNHYPDWNADKYIKRKAHKKVQRGLVV